MGQGVFNVMEKRVCGETDRVLHPYENAQGEH